MRAAVFVVMSLVRAASPEEAHFAVREDASLLESLRGGEGASFSLSAPPAHGTVGVERNGRFFYAPAADFCGEDAFSVQAGEREILVRVAITPENDAPTASVAPLLRGVEDQMLEGSIDANDIDGDALSFALERKPRRGAVDVEPASGRFRFTPPADWFGDETFSVAISDGKARSIVDVKLAIVAANDAPRTDDARASADEDAAISGRVSGNDIDGDALRFSLSRPARKGAVTIEQDTGAFVYTPRADENGEDDFLVEVGDGQAASTARVVVTLRPVQDAPHVRDTAVTGAEDEPFHAQLLAHDPDGDALRYRLVGTPRLADVTVDAQTGALAFAPHADMFGEEDVPFEVSDGTSTVTALLKVRIAPKNDAPLLEPARGDGVEDEPIVVPLQARDIDGDAVSFAVIGVRGKGRALIDGAFLRYEPGADENGDVVVRVVARDQEAASPPVDVALSLAPRNDAPRMADRVLDVREDQVLRLALTAHDPDGDPLAYAIFRQPLHGFATINKATGQLEYLPNQDFSGRDDIRVEVTDPAGLRATAHLRINVAPVKDAPMARPKTLQAPRVGFITSQLEGRHAEGRPLTFKLASEPRYGEVRIIDAKRGTFTYKSRGAGGARDTFTFVVSDGQKVSVPATVAIELAP